MKGITRENWKITESNYNRVTRRCYVTRKVNGKTFRIVGFIIENIKHNRLDSRLTVTTPNHKYVYSSYGDHIYTIMNDFSSKYESILRKENAI